jgi:uncharacterized protein YraI
MGRYGLDSSGCVEEHEAGSSEQGNKPTRNGHRYTNVLYSQSEVIVQKFSILSISTQTITHIIEHILQKYALKHTYHLVDDVSTSYVQDKHPTSMHKTA